MNRNRQLSEKTFGKRKVQPHMSLMNATKKPKKGVCVVHYGRR